MKLSRIATALLLGSVSSAALAGGPLYIHEPTMQPYKWDTSKGAIPVYTDGGPVIKNKDGVDVQTFTILEKGQVFNLDITLPDGTVIPAGTVLDRDYTFLSIAQANAITAKAVGEWSAVETSTFEMSVQGTIEQQTGIKDVNQTNVDQIYSAVNGYGFWVNYDTDGQILEQYFGVPRSQVLGIAFPEWADEETGEILEATALMNGWYVGIDDTDGEMIAGVFTHEFGHALNMSHSQANGHLSYMSASYSPQYDGVPGCAITNQYTSASQIAPDTIETMFPFINVLGVQGAEQSTVNVRDDIVNLSDLYPTAEYRSGYGSISGTLYTKEGVDYSGMNMVARNLDNPLYDVVTQQSGNLTQGLVGPDGKFTINGLTPGGRYVLYMETIKAGGYPTRQTALLSEAEYWNSNESSNPASDRACDFTPIIAEAGVTKQADIYFNGYSDGIQYTPLVSAFVLDHAKNGKRAMGITGTTPFLYDSTKKALFELHPAGNAVVAGHATMNKNATKAGVMADFSGNGISNAAIWDLRSDKLTSLGDLNGNSCGGSGQSGTNSSYVWDMDDNGDTVVGTAYLDTDGNGACQSAFKDEIVPFIWTKKAGMQQLPYQFAEKVQWLRADRIAGNGSTITGTYDGTSQVAWVDGRFHDTSAEFGAQDSSVISNDGSTVGFGTRTGVTLWHTDSGQQENIGSLRWCEQVPFNHFFLGNLCAEGWDHDSISAEFGVPRMLLLDASDDLSMITARSGSLFTGFSGGIYLEGLGWMSTREFFAKQGVTEAKALTIDNPFAISANGSEMMGGIAGAVLSIDVDLNKAFVCRDGQDVQLSFPKQVVAAVKDGAEFGRCAHLND
ncbi:MAG: hypothetical protein WAqPseu_23020 [Shewanella algae]|uniref:hypothetical protein n=1 Tax=Shewanella algae TaxID=38313 RepID=UPI0011835B41|nr:hypothetical protein [Shewanella algae]MBO2563929.1 hypothetical protein [Shewanella algae]MBO2652559.1 hypothetical protein [Shewanella algae]TVL39121.1 hypothetical protein AYI94_08100 [Shewanella algae]